MATKYFRITGYHPQDDYCFIMDSNGMFDKLWQFSVFLKEKGFQILEVSSDEKFQDIDIEKIEESTTQIFLRANSKGKPIYREKEINGSIKRIVTVGLKSYIPE